MGALTRHPAGVLVAAGLFVRPQCRECALERLVPFSCKGRGFCPSCGGRRILSRHAHLDGFDLHANVAVPAGDRARLEHLCRHLLRPAVSQDRLRLLDDGRVLLALKTAWADGTRHLLFEPVELLEKLASLTPRPRINTPTARRSTSATRKRLELRT